MSTTLSDFDVLAEQPQLDLAAKYQDESRWWETFLRDQVVPWHQGLAEINFFEAIPPHSPPGSGDPQQAVLAFRDRVSRYYFEQSWRLNTERDYGLVLDIGCGPLIPTSKLRGLVFAVDPNLDVYRAAGYPVDLYGAVLCPWAAEDLWMLPSGVFDTLLSNNALNHVNDPEATIREMERLAKPNSFWRFETEYREPTLAEPHHLNDDRVLAAFQRFRPTKLRELQWPGIEASVLWGIG